MASSPRTASMPPTVAQAAVRAARSGSLAIHLKAPARSPLTVARANQSTAVEEAAGGCSCFTIRIAMLELGQPPVASAGKSAAQARSAISHPADLAVV